MEETNAKIDENMKTTSAQENQIKQLKFQIEQIANTLGQQHTKEKYLGTTEVNPREHYKRIELRGGTKYKGPFMPISEGEEGEKK